MVLSRMLSAAIVGLEAVPIEIEVDVTTSGNSTHMVIVGLPDTAVRESKDRVLAAIRNTGYFLQECFCTVNLAPGDIKKEGTLYDLPMAVGIIYSMGKMGNGEKPSDYLIVGELGLSGETRPTRGALNMAILARKLNKKGVLIPEQNAREAAAVPGIDIIPIKSLSEAIEFLKNPLSISPLSLSLTESTFSNTKPEIDFADIKGQHHVKRAMEIAAAGGHNVIMSGPPGSGKTMLAKALIGIMPELSVEEALETTKIHSIAGLLKNGEYVVHSRPFRSPHHTISNAGLIGGGNGPRPGEVSLAHNGILFLDEFPEFSKSVLEVLRQPLEDCRVTISRANGHVTFPTDFICIAAMNPCPCGMLGHPTKVCKDSQAQIDKYRNKISAPLWDRLDLHIEVPAVSYHDITQQASSETSSTVKSRVLAARKKQRERFGVAKTNSRMTPHELKTFVPLNEACQEVVKYAVNTLGLSARACDRLRRIGRTIADLAGAENVDYEHLMEAIHYCQIKHT